MKGEHMITAFKAFLLGVVIAVGYFMYLHFSNRNALPKISTFGAVKHIFIPGTVISAMIFWSIIIAPACTLAGYFAGAHVLLKYFTLSPDPR